jgi:hypothetical protein
MSQYKELGKKAYSLGDDGYERFEKKCRTKVEAEVRSRKTACELDIRKNAAKEKELSVELARFGDISRGVLTESLIRGVIALLFFVFASAGELVFCLWLMGFAGLSSTETLLIAITFVLLVAKAVDQYIEMHRRRFPESSDDLFLAAACIGLVFIITSIVLSAHLRQIIHQTVSSIGDGGTLETTVEQAKYFYKGSSRLYMFMLATLSMAFALVGGVAFHEGKNRILTSLPALRCYRQLDKARELMAIRSQEIIELDTEMVRFDAEFDEGYMEAAREEKEKTLSASQKAETGAKGRVSEFGRLLSHIIFLVFLALFVGFLLVGLAGAGEHHQHIIFLDVSGSESVKDYTGNNTEFEMNRKGIGAFIRNDLGPATVIKVFGITENTFSRPYILLEGATPADKGRFGEKIAAEKLTLSKKWESLEIRPNAKATDILGAAYLASVLYSGKSGSRHLTFFSDMRECSKVLDLERPSSIDVERALKKVEEARGFPRLDGVGVRCLGVHGAGKLPSYWLGLRAFWISFFKRCNAQMLTFNIERRMR